MQPFVGDVHSVRHAASASAATPTPVSTTPPVAPLVQLDTDLWALELFHGPTLAFKDMAMQLLGRLFDHVLAQRDARVTIVGATSGDTGSAAIEACAGPRRASTSSSCTRTAAPARCSGGR